MAWSIGHTLLDRPVSARHGLHVWRIQAHEASGRSQTRFAAVEWMRIEANLDRAATVAAVGLEPAVVGRGDQRRQTLAEIVSPFAPDVIGMPTQLGRPLAAGDHAPGTPPRAVISARLWRDLFDRAAGVPGEALVVNGRSFTVVGVASNHPPTTFPGGSVDLWVPLEHGEAFYGAGWKTAPDRRVLSLFVLPTAARAETIERLRSAASGLEAEYPRRWRARALTLAPGTVLIGSQRGAAVLLSRILFGLALLILAVAAANVSGLLLTFLAAGRRAAVIDVALGAGTAAAPRRALMQGAMIGTAAGAIATMLYAWVRVQMADVPLLPTLTLSLPLPGTPRVLAMLLPIGLATGVLAAAGPAFWIARLVRRPFPTGTSARLAGDRGIARTRRVLIGLQVMVSLVLLVGASLFGRSLDRLVRADLGIVRDGLVAMDFDIEPAGMTGSDSERLGREVLARARALPGVVAAAMASRAPVDSSTPATRVTLAAGDAGASVEVTFTTVTAGYFETVGTPLLHGRAFAEKERADVVIVNDTLARRLWPDGSSLGRTLVLIDERRTAEVIGVARNARYRTIAESGQAHVYLPMRPTLGHALLVRTTGDARRALLDLQKALDSIGPGLTGFFPRTQEDHLAIQWLPTQLARTAALWLSGLALALCAAALYGLVSWFGELRQMEMAIRLALGATPRHIAGLMLRQALATAVPGLLAGVPLALGAAAAARGLLFGLEPADGLTLAAGSAIILLLVVVAGWRPAQRVARADPAVTLRA